MKKLLSISALLFALLFATHANATGTRPADMTASGAIVGTQIVWCPIGTTSDLKCTFTQVAAYINSLVSGDCTATGTGTFTCTKTNGTAFGALATATPGTGVATAIGNALNAAGGLVGFNQKASNTQFGIMEGDGTTITCTAGLCSAAPSVTSRTVTGATDTILAGDLGNVVYYNSASSIAITQPAPSGSFAAGFFTTICQINNGVATVTPGSGTIGGASTYALPAGGTAAAPLCATYQSDGTNFNVVPYFVRNNTTTTASGTSSLGTGAITSATCATAVTTSATGVATTDAIQWGFNGDPTGVTGYAPVTTGALTIFAYPSANNVNFKVCNLTTASITPGAITLNWRVVR